MRLLSARFLSVLPQGWQRDRADDLRENRERTGDRVDDETQVFRDDCAGPKFLDNLGRHESRLERAFYRAPA